MATIKDVAQRANVSTCTVSRVLSQKGYISDKTRAAVLQAVEELKYQPNSIATELKVGVSNTIGLIVPDITNYYYMELAAQIERYANAEGHLIYLCNSSYDRAKEKKFVTALTNRKIKGLIVIPVSNEIGHFLELQKKSIPFAFVNRTFPNAIDFCIAEDNRGAAYEVVSHLKELKRARIAGIFQSFDNMIYQERYEGMKQAILDQGNGFDESLIIYNAEMEKTCERIEELFRRPDRPDAIFAANDMLAFDVYKVLDGLHLRIPQDVMVVGFDDTLMAQKISPPLSSYKMPIDVIAYRSVKAVLNGGLEQAALPISGKLVKRQSTANLTP